MALDAERRLLKAPFGQTSNVADLGRAVAVRLSKLDGLEEGESMFGPGRAYWVNGKEVAHFEAPGVIEIRCTRTVIREQRTALKADPRVILRPRGSDWLAVRFDTTPDVELVVRLVALAVQAHLPPPGTLSKPVPTGADLERRKRFH